MIKLPCEESSAGEAALNNNQTSHNVPKPLHVPSTPSLAPPSDCMYEAKPFCFLMELLPKREKASAMLLCDSLNVKIALSLDKTDAIAASS